MLKDKVRRILSIPGRAKNRLHPLLHGRLRCFSLAVSLVKGKRGLEIGGPTDVFQGWRTPTRNHGCFAPLPIYDKVESLDNCNFSKKTIWGNHQDLYRFSPYRGPGRIIIADGSDIAPVASHTYDFILSSHNLEHFANPVKALKEWERITRPGGALILVLPDYRRTFDHRRPPTLVSHMFEDYVRNVEEDDSTHIAEVLRLHDLNMDGTLKTHTLEELTARSINNLSNRTLHHHVFDEHNSTELLAKVGLEILAVELAPPYHIFILAKWKE